MPRRIGGPAGICFEEAAIDFPFLTEIVDKESPVVGVSFGVRWGSGLPEAVLEPVGRHHIVRVQDKVSQFMDEGVEFAHARCVSRSKRGLSVHAMSRRMSKYCPWALLMPVYRSHPCAGFRAAAVVFVLRACQLVP